MGGREETQLSGAAQVLSLPAGLEKGRAFFALPSDFTWKRSGGGHSLHSHLGLLIQAGPISAPTLSPRLKRLRAKGRWGGEAFLLLLSKFDLDPTEKTSPSPAANSSISPGGRDPSVDFIRFFPRPPSSLTDTDSIGPKHKVKRALLSILLPLRAAIYKPANKPMEKWNLERRRSMSTGKKINRKFPFESFLPPNFRTIHRIALLLAVCHPFHSFPLDSISQPNQLLT